MTASVTFVTGIIPTHKFVTGFMPITWKCENCGEVYDEGFIRLEGWVPKDMEISISATVAKPAAPLPQVCSKCKEKEENWKKEFGHDKTLKEEKK